MDGLKQRTFAASFGSSSWQEALRRYADLFERDEEEVREEDLHEFEPESEQDIVSMLNEARRAGAID